MVAKGLLEETYEKRQRRRHSWPLGFRGRVPDFTRVTSGTYRDKGLHEVKGRRKRGIFLFRARSRNPGKKKGEKIKASGPFEKKEQLISVWFGLPDLDFKDQR